MKSEKNIVGLGKFIVRNKPINKVGLDTSVLIALIDNDLLVLNKPKMYIKSGICFAYQTVINQTIGILVNKRGYTKEEAISKILNYLRENNIKVIRKSDINKEKRDFIYEDLKKQRNKIKVRPKPEDSDLDILASYKVKDIDLIFTTNFKHFIELGKYLSIFIEGIYSEKQQTLKDVDKMWRDVFWSRRKKYR